MIAGISKTIVQSEIIIRSFKPATKAGAKTGNIQVLIVQTVFGIVTVAIGMVGTNRKGDWFFSTEPGFHKGGRIILVLSAI